VVDVEVVLDSAFVVGDSCSAAVVVVSGGSVVVASWA
jgi:hypothetical protein